MATLLADASHSDATGLSTVSAISQYIFSFRLSVVSFSGSSTPLMIRLHSRDLFSKLLNLFLNSFNSVWTLLISQCRLKFSSVSSLILFSCLMIRSLDFCTLSMLCCNGFSAALIPLAMFSTIVLFNHLSSSNNSGLSVISDVGIGGILCLTLEKVGAHLHLLLPDSP